MKTQGKREAGIENRNAERNSEKIFPNVFLEK